MTNILLINTNNLYIDSNGEYCTKEKIDDYISILTNYKNKMNNNQIKKLNQIKNIKNILKNGWIK